MYFLHLNAEQKTTSKLFAPPPPIQEADVSKELKDKVLSFSRLERG